MKILLLIPLVLVAFLSSGQQTANYINNWYLGIGSGISFNSGAPVNIASNITAYEVSTSFSDGAGNTLFYAGAISPTSNGSGFTVWDASNTTMPNGDVSINYSQSCGLTAVPVPGNCDQYYIFALAVVGGANYGLRYSVVDMTLPGNGTVPTPLGDIVPGQKDVLVFSADTLAEKLKIVQKGNTEDYWVITRSLNNDLFYSFEVTSSGVNPVPIVSTISATNWPTSIGSPIFGWLAVNKDRTMLAEANGFGPDAKIFGFDNQTGVVSAGETIIPTGAFGVDIEYGIEFSPDGNALYVSWIQGGTNTQISSFDVTAGFGAIAATRQDFPIAVGPAEYGALVKGPDGKIYGTRTTNAQLTVINTPNNYLAPTIVSPGYNPAPGIADVGMPNMTYYFHPDNFIDTLAGNDRDICENDQATIGAIGYDSLWATYSWEPAVMVVDPTNAVTQTIPLTADQEFILTTITSCGDTIKVDSVMVTVGAALDAEIVTNSPICDGDQLQLNGSPTGLGSGNYAWVGPNGLTLSGYSGVFITPFPNPIPGGWYYLTVTNGNCTDTDSSFVVANPVYNITEDFDVCENTLYTYPDGTQSTITANESYISNLVTLAGCDSTITTNVTMVLAMNVTDNVSVCENDVYTFPDGTQSIIVANETNVTTLVTVLGCDSIITTNVTMIPEYTSTVTVNLCAGEDYIYADGTVSNNILANESYTSNLTGVLGCDSIITEDLVINGPLAPTAGTSATYCDGDPLNDLTATAGSGGTLTWYSDVGLSTVLGTGTTFPSSNTLGSTSYFVTETTGGCESNATEVIITINPIPGAPTVSSAQSYCEGETIPDLTATASSGGTLTWYSDAGFTNSIGTGTTLPIAQGIGTTTYYVVESVGSCVGTASSVDITIFPNPTANAGTDVTVLAGESTTLFGSGGTGYLWSPPTGLSCTSCQSTEATPDITTIYILTVTDANGCMHQDSVLVTINFEEQDFFVPSVFSPNGDNLNDFFEIKGTGLYDFYLRVFNRWGELIFESDDQSISWDGQQNGKSLNTAVFAYTLTYTDTFGVAQVVSGNVTLIK